MVGEVHANENPFFDGVVKSGEVNSVLVRQLDPFLITRRGEATRRRNQRNSKKIRVNENNAAACVDCGVSFGIYMRKYY